jgi:hypothetical protein
MEFESDEKVPQIATKLSLASPYHFCKFFLLSNDSKWLEHGWGLLKVTLRGWGSLLRGF